MESVRACWYCSPCLWPLVHLFSWWLEQWNSVRTDTVSSVKYITYSAAAGMFAFHVMFVMKEVQDKLRQSICFFLSNYHVSPQNIPRNCCFTPLCIWLDDLLAENAWSCGNLESNIAFVALRKLVHLWGFFWCLKKFSRRYDHRSSLSSRFIILKHLEFRICTLGIPFCNAWVVVSLCLS